MIIIIASIVNLSDQYGSEIITSIVKITVLLLSYIHTNATTKTFLIPLQGPFGMSKGSLHVFHLYVRTGAAVDASLCPYWCYCGRAYGFVYKEDKKSHHLYLNCHLLILQGQQVIIIQMKSLIITMIQIGTVFDIYCPQSSQIGYIFPGTALN